ncbi:dihydrolipoamide acetyltransferase family protein [Schlesneria paludicola]|uniref:dihydrolipoamide acetyltransferase family protein n=1 Tax=Schlesneria paludicola TaxID=360056 RepID=UPI000299ED13|nr:dihydrolipoamide acetyltransferase family protein [Schlesneria paludicola]
MPFEITVPRLGWSMEEGTFVRWLKKHGELVNAGDALFELEGEKAAQDIEAVDSGLLVIPSNAPQPGTIVAVGAVIGHLVAEGEAAPAVVTGASASVTSSIPKTSAPANPSPAADTSTLEEPAAAPSVRRLAREMGVKLASLEGSGPAGRITANDVRTTGSRPSTVAANHVLSSIASPRARRVAKELGIDWKGVKGTGRDGRVRERDVRTSQSQPRPASTSTPTTISSRRRTIANRMIASRERTAPVTLTTRIDATNLVGLRLQFKQAGEGSPIPSYTDLIIKLVALALRKHPTLATRDEGGQWIVPASADDIYIGMAVDTEDGLVVPVVSRAATLGLFDLAKQTLSLIEKARTGKISAADMQGGVFTITNLGSFGIDAFTPIINLPETAVLGLGRIRREPVVIDDQIVARDQMSLSLTFDHRIVDGAPAARFLQTVSQAIENPSAWLLRGDI